MSIWVPTSYVSPSMFFVLLQLISSSNSPFLTLGVKSSKMSFFLPISQNNDLSSNLNSNRQNEAKGMLGFENRASDIKLLKFHAINIIVHTSKNVIFNISSFVNSVFAIEFVASKRVRQCLSILRPPLDSWRQNEFEKGLILILSPGWPCMQNEANLHWYFSQFVSKNMIFFTTTPNIDKLHTKSKLTKRLIDTY